METSNSTFPHRLGWVSGNFRNGHVAIAISTVLTLMFITSMIRFVKYRREFMSLHGNLKSPPFSMLFGTIGGLVETFRKVPVDAHPNSVFTMVHRMLKLDYIYYMDNWPAAPWRQMVIIDPGVAAQITQTRVLKKHRVIKDMLVSILGSKSMLITEGAEWKRARSAFNPGLTLSHLMTLVPGIVDDSMIFRDVLLKAADSEQILQIEVAARYLAIDIMGRVILDFSFNSQILFNGFVNTFLAAVEVLPEVQSDFSPRRLNFVSYIKRNYYERKMNAYLGKVLDDRQKLRESNAKDIKNTKRGRKPVIDLALDEYNAQQEEENRIGKRTGSDQEFRQFAIDNMKTFLQAGYDTTSSTLAYVYYLLSRHREALERVRVELDQVFGDNANSIEERIKSNPYLINKLDYLTAVIKETLRLFPPVSGVRQGDNSDIIYKGQKYNTKDFMVWIEQHTLHRRPDLFPSPDEFIPERFLPAPNNWQEIPKDAWRPFEKGPRACAGQELAMLELKIIITLTIKDLDIVDAYEDYDRKMGRKNPGETLDGKRGMFGYRSYQTLSGSAKPVDGMPVYVKRMVT